jgi:hypothetical protein
MSLKQVAPILILFVVTNSLLLTANVFYNDIANINFKFIMTVNLMLFVLAIFNFNRIRKIDIKNPRALVNSVMIGTILKMVVLAGAALIYATQKKAPVGMPTLLSCMGLYLIYTWLEIKWTKAN